MTARPDPTALETALLDAKARGLRHAIAVLEAELDQLERARRDRGDVVRAQRAADRDLERAKAWLGDGVREVSA